MTAGWGDLLRGGNAARSAIVGGGMIVQAISTFVVVTILPSVVRDIGGLRFFAWSTTLYVVACLFGGALCARVLVRVGPRWTYRAAIGLVALGCAICATAPTMPVLLAGRFVQGLGAGTLSALSFTMMRLFFDERLWPRALAGISAVWGVATLLGPALGGIFAQYTGWRIGFWALFALAPCLLILIEVAMPRAMPQPQAPRARLAVANLMLLAAVVLCVSAGSMAVDPRLNLMGVAVACAGLAVFVWREAGEGRRLLPRGACNPATILGAAYMAMALLNIGVNVEIFVPYFLQTLHGMTPLHAGYLSALMAAGWVLGALSSSSATPSQARIALGVGPLTMAVGLVALSLYMAVPGGVGTGGGGFGLVAIGAGMFAIGSGLGVCWPHLGARVFAAAPVDERELASASITVVAMVANALGSALGGLMTNMAGLTVPGGVLGASAAASWLFGAFLGAPVLAFLVTRRLRRVEVLAA